MSTPRGKDEYARNYKRIFEAVSKLGHENVTDFLLDVEVEEFYISNIKKFYNHTVVDLKKADICVFEVSMHSLAIGHLISMAVEYGKPILALHVKGKDPFFLKGIDNDKIQICEYDLADLKEILTVAIDYASELMDTRFNFFISPKIANYLDWVARKKRTPRAVYLRQLIEKDMKESKKKK